MARTARVKADGEAFYHTMSRITGQTFLLKDQEVKRDMLDCLRRAAYFSGVEVGCFAIMDNHFHVAFRIPARDPGTVTEDEVLDRYAMIRGDGEAGRLKRKLDRLAASGDVAACEAELDRLRVRMYDLSQFMKTFKEMFGLRFRKRHPHVGTIWGERFKSTHVENAEYLRICAKYIDLNPVRAKIAKHADDYAWNTVGAAKRGDAFAKSCLAWLQSIFLGDCPQQEWMLRRCPQIGAGKVLGSRAFVEGEIKRLGGTLRSGSLAAREARDGVFALYGHRIDRKAKAA